MDEEAPPDKKPEKPSQIPSWVTLGFILGALFVLARQHTPSDETVERSLPRRAGSLGAGGGAQDGAGDGGGGLGANRETPSFRRAPVRPNLSTIEDVFAVHGHYAVWEGDTTEVALWNQDTKSWDWYEVLRLGGNVYFRTIPQRTRPELTHGVPKGGGFPLAFTESEQQHEEWLGEVHKEDWRQFTDSAHKVFGGPRTEESPVKTEQVPPVPVVTPEPPDSRFTSPPAVPK